MKPPALDTRSGQEIYERALALARKHTADWAAGFGEAPDYSNRTDPGLALLHLFSDLYIQVANQLNAAPNKYRLAFWDFLGLSLRSPKPAETAMWFQLEGTTPTRIAAGTQITSSGDSSIVFETDCDLRLLPAWLSNATAIRPNADAFQDYTSQISGQGAAFPLFADDPGQLPIPHRLYISDPKFDTQDAQGTLKLTFAGVNLSRKYFERWTDGAGNEFAPSRLEVGNNQLTVEFSLPPAIPVSLVDGENGLWLAVAPAAGVQVLGFQVATLPRIYHTIGEISVAGIKADAAFFNAVSIDLKKGGQPFGRTPAVEDAFYLASTTGFSKTGATISLNFTLQRVDPPEEAVLRWEYWDGAQWVPMAVEDETRNLTRSGIISFQCPKIEKSKVNKVDNYWIRAVLSQGGYGTPQGRLVTTSAKDVVDGVLAPYLSDPDAALAALKKDDIDFGIAFKPADFAPPFIQHLTIEAASYFGPDKMLTLNGTDYARLVTQPYIPTPETQPTFYLGFDRTGFAEAVAGADLSVYLAFQKEDPTLLPTVGDPSDTLALRFEYFDGGEWKPVNAAALSPNVKREGIVALSIPPDIAPGTLFSQSLFWLRILPPSAQENRLSKLHGIFPNAVPALNAVRHGDVILGSATGEPGQVFDFPHRPVLDKLDVQVLEPAPGGSGHSDLTDQWVSWSEVSNFDFATPQSRVFTVDHSLGTLTFGDGVRGRIPQKGAHNVRAALYYSGGGTAGNRPAHDLSSLRAANPLVRAVTNVEDAQGGVDADPMDDLFTRAPGQVRARDRAVTLRDYIALATDASQQVARATGRIDGLTRIDMVVLPAYAGATPSPSFALRNLVGRYLGTRCLAGVAREISVGGPEYLPIAVSCEIVMAPGTTRDSTRKQIALRLTAFFMPLSGGRDGAGWDFAATVRAADLSAAIAEADGVTRVNAVALERFRVFLVCGWNQLPTFGSVEVRYANAV